MSTSHSVERDSKPDLSSSTHMAARAAPHLGHGQYQTILGSIEAGRPGVKFHTNQLPIGRLTDGALPPEPILNPAIAQRLQCQC